MASEIAKMVAGAKLKQVTGDIEGALGVDAESEAARAKEADRTVERQLARRREERERIKQDQHEQKEVERQKIREKYVLNKESKPTKSTKSADLLHKPSRDPTPEYTEKKCTLS